MCTETDGTLLDGRVRYHQFRHGYRTGIEPVLLAAAVPAKPGQRVVEGGSGAGAALLCLARRVDITGLGLERDPALAALAGRNAAANGFTERLEFQAATVESLGADRQRFHHAMANPPWHDPAGTSSPDPGRDAAKRAPAGLLAGWIAALAGCLHHRGTLSLILPAAGLNDAMAGMAAHGAGSIRVTPLWPKAGRPAVLVLVQATRGGKAATMLLPGLMLHRPEGGYTESADLILRHGQALASALLGVP